MRMRISTGIISCLVMVLALASFSCLRGKDKIGVIFIIHGGMEIFTPQYMWDAAILQFSFDLNHSVNKLVIWNRENWPMVLDTDVSEFTLKYLRLYTFEYDRIGGADPFNRLSLNQLEDLKAGLDANPYGLTFEADWTGYQCADQPEHYPYPRYIYYGPDGPGVGDNMDYCGEAEPDGPWAGCNPERYNVDGPVERLLSKGVTRIIAVDWMMGGARYMKSLYVVRMLRLAIDHWNQEQNTNIPYPLWINDYSNLMDRSYPVEPPGWTASMVPPAPIQDSHVLLNSGPNPIAADDEVAVLDADAIEKGMSATVSDAETGVIIVNHAQHAEYNETFDPKVNDTMIVNKKIKTLLLERHPTMDPDNIIGAYFGRQVLNPANGLIEHSREMRGEVYGKAWLYESNKQMPGDEWGYHTWDALEYLKNRGVKHIVIGNPQVVTASVLDRVEIHNQIGREVGIKSWAQWNTGDFTHYPTEGHPFADYWGMWVYTDCGEWELPYDSGTAGFSDGATLSGVSSGASGTIKWKEGDTTAGTLVLKKVTGTFQEGELITDSKGGSARVSGPEVITSKTECCFEMGGCGDPLRPYPPHRQTPINQVMSDLDPCLAYDMSDYGLLGYNPDLGPPNPNGPVQDQYTGTWVMYTPPSDDPRVGEMLARHVINAAMNPLVYITNGEVESVSAGESVTFEAHLTGGGTAPFTYEWSLMKDGDNDWSVREETGSQFTWSPASGAEGTYTIRCKVRDRKGGTGEITWEDFVVS